MRIVVIIIAIFVLGSCSSLQRFTYDKYKQEHTLTSKLDLIAYTQERGLFGNYNKPYSTLSFEHFAKVSDTNGKTVYLTITHEYDQLIDPPDSILFIDIDGEFTKLAAATQSTKQFVSAQTSHQNNIIKEESLLNDNEEEEDDNIEVISTSKTTLNKLERTKQVFDIPVELFEPIAKARKITFRQYIGNQAIDIIPMHGEKQIICSFYRNVIQK